MYSFLEGSHSGKSPGCFSGDAACQASLHFPIGRLTSDFELSRRALRAGFVSQLNFSQLDF
jgi:hypothetical protein